MLAPSRRAPLALVLVTSTVLAAAACSGGKVVGASGGASSASSTGEGGHAASAAHAASAVASTSTTSTTGSGGAGTSTSGSTTSTSTSTGTGGSSTSSSSGTGGSLGGDPATCADAASIKTNVGCDFWPTVVANNVWSIFDYAVVVANAGTQTADLTVTQSGKTVQSAQVAPGALATLYLPWVPELKGPDTDNCGSVVPLIASVRSTGGAYHLVSTSPVSVYQFSALEYQGQGGPPGKDWSACPGDQLCSLDQIAVGCFSFTNDASLLLPTTALTGNYRLTSESGWATGMIGAVFTITGTQDNTGVTVYLPTNGHVVASAGATDGGVPNIPDTAGGGMITFTVNAGDVVELLGTTTGDNAGARVAATAPVQVIAGSPCMDVPDMTSACDHLEQSVLPAETLGKHYFVTVPTAPHGNAVGHVVRLIGNVDGTNLTYPSGTKPAGAPATLAAGQVVDLGEVTADFEIQADHEIAVADFMLGGSLLDPNAPTGMQLGDPSQSDVIPVEQYRTKHVFVAPTDYSTSYVDIVAPTGATLQLDGQVLTAAPTTIGSGYGIVRQLLGPGNGGAHVLLASAPVGIQVIGYGQYTSYMYPGGLNLEAIAPPPVK